MEDIIKKPNISNGKTIEYNGITLKVPDGFRVYSNEGIQKEILDKYGKIIGFDTISYRPVLIKSILKNYDTDDEKLELVFCDTGKTLIVEKSEIFSSSKIVKLSNKGMQVNSNNSRSWIDFLSNLEAINLDILPKKKTINRLGWIDENTFIPYNNNEFELDVDDSTYSWVKSLEEKGSLIEWVHQMEKLRDNPIFRFILATSFSAPLLKITNTRSFVIYNWAMSKGGKTATAHCAMSVWGLAESLKVSFDATRVGVEGLSKIFADMPILIDEKQIDNNQSKVEEIVYMFANGKSKLRGTHTRWSTTKLKMESISN